VSLALMLELAWKSGLIAAAALLGASLLRTRPASERVAVLRLGMTLIVALPLLVTSMPALHIQPPALFGRAISAELAVDATSVVAVRRVAISAASVSSQAQERRVPAQITPVVAISCLWGVGFGLLMLRLLAGVVLLNRWTLRAAPVSDGRWLAALARTDEGGISPALLASPQVNSPLSWRWWPAVILLDGKTLSQPGRADAVLAHEMGHIRNRDWLFLMASRLLVCLFWFNPLVWLLQRELARQSEQAADAWAAGRVGRVDYAAALVAMASRGQPQAALGMAAPKGEIARRVVAILKVTSGRGKPWGAIAACLVCLGFVTPLAAVELRAPVEMSSTARVAAAEGLTQIAALPRDGSVAHTWTEASSGISNRSADEVAARPPSPSNLMQAVRRTAAAGFNTSIDRVAVDLDDPAFGDAQDDFPSADDWNGRPNREQRRQAAQQLRDAADLLDGEIDRMRRNAIKIDDPEHRRQTLDDTNEMKAEATAVRRQADAMEHDG